ncbi:MAG: NAD(P)-binding protein [Oscillospiraceae bacterium]|nr:NAD(P)-binding protein [Oscillospiraceae bacterium]
MDKDTALAFSKGCFRGEPASCMNACPFRLDIRAFADKMKNGQLSAAYRQLRNDLVFPETVSALCDAPCEGHCARQFLDESVRLHDLETACFAETKKKEPQVYRLPPRAEKVAVIGGGLSGLICALRLAIRKYSVTVYESGESWGGSLRDHPAWERMKAEITAQMSPEKIEFVCGRPAESPDIPGADAVYVATGAGGADFGLLDGRDPGTLATVRKGVFLGGKLTGCDDIRACLHGMLAAQQIEGYLLSGNMPKSADGEPAEFCERYIGTEGEEKRPAVVPAGDHYTKEEAAAEAGRCLQCDCGACIEACELLRKYRKDPIRIATEIYQDAVVVPGASMRTIGREVSSCNFCGLCAKVCPEGVDVGAAMLYSRRDRVRMGILPPAFHDHWLREMTFALGDASLVMVPGGAEKCEYVFFPGCQLGASDPRYVEKAYADLAGALGANCGLLLECCGIPARWAGMEELENAVAERLREQICSLGNPTVICACTSCERSLREKLPDTEVVSLYGVLARMPGEPGKTETQAAVFDPCAASEDADARDGVRALAERAGIRVHELSGNGERARCCGFGGHIRAANPELFEEIAQNRAYESDLPYVTYCANCRETFAARGKQAMHILDALYGLDDGRRPAVPIRQRKRNMLQLKKDVMETYMGQTFDIPREPWEDLELEIPGELREKMERTLISEDTVRRAVYEAENGGTRFNKQGVFIASTREGVVTVWVHYKAEDGKYSLCRVYSHRMEITGGQNG